MVYKRVKGWTSGRSFPPHSLPNGAPCRLFTVPYFPVSRKIVEIERYALRVAILGEYQKYFAGGGGRFRRKREKYFSRPPPPRATCMIPDPRPPPPRYIWKSRWPPLTPVIRDMSRRSHGKIGDWTAYVPFDIECLVNCSIKNSQTLISKQANDVILFSFRSRSPFYNKYKATM